MLRISVVLLKDVGFAFAAMNMALADLKVSRTNFFSQQRNKNA